jgi:ribonuclease HI
MRPIQSCEVYIDGASRGNPGPAGIGVVFLDLPAALPSNSQGAAQAGLPAAALVCHPELGTSRRQEAGGKAKPAWRFSKYLGETTNNVAEYLALIYALQEALQKGYTSLTVKTDSELLARQVNGQYKVRDARLRLFHDLVLHLVRGFHSCQVQHIPRTQNRLADRLAGQAVRRGQIPST